MKAFQNCCRKKWSKQRQFVTDRQIPRGKGHSREMDKRVSDGLRAEICLLCRRREAETAHNWTTEAVAAKYPYSDNSNGKKKKRKFYFLLLYFDQQQATTTTALLIHSLTHLLTHSITLVHSYTRPLIEIQLNNYWPLKYIWSLPKNLYKI